MRGESNRSVGRILASAAGLGVALAAPAARGDFNLSWQQAVSAGGYTDWVLTAQYSGGPGPQIVLLDLTMSTPGSFTSTAGAILIDLNNDIDGDGAADADVTGQADQNGIYPKPSFGSAIGTFVGFNTSPQSSLYLKSANTYSYQNNGVFVNSQTYANHTIPIGPAGTSTPGAPALYETEQTADGLTSELDPAFLNGSVHSLEVQVLATVNCTAAHPIANLVIPTGTVGTAIAILEAPDTEMPPVDVETHTISTPAVSGPLISLSAYSFNPPAGSITLSGGNKTYPVQEVAVPAGAQTTGALTVNGFNPAADPEIYVLAVDADGVLASGNLAGIIADIQGNLPPLDAVVTPFASLPASEQALFTPGVYNVAISFPTGNSSNGLLAGSPDVLQWNFANYTGNGAITITDIGVIPEPTSMGSVILCGMALLGRRRAAFSR